MLYIDACSWHVLSSRFRWDLWWSGLVWFTLIASVR